MKNKNEQPKSEIYQRFFKREIIKTKKNKLLEVKRPVGVFVARKTNKGNVIVSLSLVHKKDKFNMKDGVNQARKNAKRTGDSVNLSNEHSEALKKFIKRASKYFRVEIPTEKEEKCDWTGKVVELMNSVGLPLNTPTFYKVVADKGDVIDVVFVGYKKTNVPGDRIFKSERRMFRLAK